MAEQTEAEALQAELDEMGNALPQKATRNINTDVHQGYAAQRPYAALEDRLGAVTRGWPSFEAMLTSVRAVKGRNTDMYKRDDGTFYRLRQVHGGEGSTRIKDGKLQQRVVYTEAPVALTRDDARAIQGDFWNGRTWVRNGMKAELDAPENRGNAETYAKEEWVEASAADQAVHQQQLNQAAARKPVIPVAESKGKE